MINFNELNLETSISSSPIQVNGHIVEVNNYLPMMQKASLIEYVVDHALDENTGRFSPVRTDLFFNLAIAHFYGGIVFDDDVLALDAYDALETSGALQKIIQAIPSEEYKTILGFVNETVADIAEYNSSFAGIIKTASNDTNGLNEQIQTILEKVKNREGLETLDEIKNVVGND